MQDVNSATNVHHTLQGAVIPSSGSVGMRIQYPFFLFSCLIYSLPELDISVILFTLFLPLYCFSCAWVLTVYLIACTWCWAKSLWSLLTGRLLTNILFMMFVESSSANVVTNFFILSHSFSSLASKMKRENDDSALCNSHVTFEKGLCFFESLHFPVAFS